jgi:protein-disulfide isomerase
MEPIVNGLETEFGAEVTFLRLDAAVRENIQLQQSYGVRGHPSFVLLDAGNQTAATFIGPQSPESLRQALEQIADSKE